MGIRGALVLFVAATSSGCQSSVGSSGAGVDARLDTAEPATDATMSRDRTSVVDDASPDAPRGDAGDAGPEGGVCGVGADAGPGGTLTWIENAGRTGFVLGESVAVDSSSGDVLVAGQFQGTIDFGGGALSTASSCGDAGFGTCDAMFVARLEGGGKYVWAKAFYTRMDGEAVATDRSGNVFLVAHSSSTESVDFGGGPITPPVVGSFYVVKLDPTGAYLWGRAYAGIGDLAIDSAGNVVLGGSTPGADFGGGKKTGFFAAKLDGAGAYVWSVAWKPAMTGTGGPSLSGLAVGPLDDVLLAVTSNGTLDIGGHTFPPEAGTIVAKLSASNGAVEWASAHSDGVDAGANDVMYTSGIAVDVCGEVYIAGQWNTKPSGRIYLARIDSSGKPVWWRDFGAVAKKGSGACLGPPSIVVDGAGRLVLTDWLCGGTLDFGGGALTGPGGGPAYVDTTVIASFDLDGAYRWAYSAGGTSTVSAPLGLAASGSSVVVSGQFGACSSYDHCTKAPPGAHIVLAGKTLDAVSVEDMFVARFTP